MPPSSHTDGQADSRADLYRDSRGGAPPAGSYRRAWWSLLGALVVLGVLFAGGEYLQRWVGYKIARAPERDPAPVPLSGPLRDMTLGALQQLPRPWAERRLLESGLRVYDLQLRPSALESLHKTAELVTAKGIATGVPRPYVDAEFREWSPGQEQRPRWADGDWVSVQVKSRGLYPTHYLKRRPSLRVKFPKGRYFEGKRQINLSEPYDKGLVIDVTTNMEARRHGILTWDDRFVIVRINGKVLGIYQEIEQFGRSMADANLRPEGFIYSGHGQFFSVPGSGYDKSLQALGRLMTCHTDPGAPVSPACDWAMIDTYFDTDRLAWAMALMTLVHSSHALDPDNLRVFWDPSWGRFEPIPWDYFAFPIPPSRPDGELHPAGYVDGLFGAAPLRRMRDVRLWELLQTRVEPMLAWADALFARLEPVLQQDIRHPTIGVDRQRHAEYKRLMRANRDLLVGLYQRADLRVQVWQVAGQTRLAVDNRAKAHVMIDAVQLAGGAQTSVPLPEPVTVDGQYRERPGRAVFALSLPEGGRISGLSGHNGVTGEALRADQVVVEVGQGQAVELPAPPTVTFAPALAGVQRRGDDVVFGPGTVRLAQTLEVPAGLRVVLAPGLDLRLADGASLIVHGDLRAWGTAEQRITVTGFGPKGAWGTLAVHGRPERPSRVDLRYLEVRGGVGGQDARVLFTSPLAVHGGIVRMDHCSILDGRANDGMNLKYCQIDVRALHMRGSIDDAFDCDFCRGTIVDSRIEQSGGDGLDFSGSRLTVRNNHMERCADKGISVGEHTHIRIFGGSVTGGRTGIAVKDLSQAEVRDVLLERLEVGLHLYVKKPTFGPSHAVVRGVQMKEVKVDRAMDALCTLDIQP